jgi:hypothetical protein
MLGLDLSLWLKGALEMSLTPPAYVAGRWYLPPTYSGAVSPGLAFGTANVLRMHPVLITRPVTISELACNVSTADSGKFIQLGIYNSSPTTLYPTTLVDKTASITLTGTGIKSAAVSGGTVTLPIGLYWFTVNSDSTLVVCIRYATGVPFGSIVIGSTTATTALANGGTVMGLTTPDTFGTWTADITGNTFTELTSSQFAAMLMKAA